MRAILRVPPSSAGPVTGLDSRTLGNGVAGGDLRLRFTGSNLPSRTAHTILWKAFYAQQTGYYAVTWFDENTGVYQFSQYESGAHPFPCSGEHAATGEAQEGGISGGTGSGGTAHRWELAGVGNGSFTPDYICTAGVASPPSRGLLVNKGVWTYSARTSEIVGSTLRRKYYPDLLNSPTFSIVQDAVLADLNSPANPAFTFGASPWTSSNFAGTGSGYTNDETPCCILRFLMIFSGAALSLSDITAEFANESTAGAWTSAGQSSLWYSRKNPTPSSGGVDDQSGANHTPTWANANRPLLYAA